jgi:hypothetical protein
MRTTPTCVPSRWAANPGGPYTVVVVRNLTLVGAYRRALRSSWLLSATQQRPPAQSCGPAWPRRTATKCANPPSRVVRRVAVTDPPPPRRASSAGVCAGGRGGTPSIGTRSPWLPRPWRHHKQRRRRGRRPRRTKSHAVLTKQHSQWRPRPVTSPPKRARRAGRRGGWWRPWSACAPCAASVLRSAVRGCMPRPSRKGKAPQRALTAGLRMYRPHVS